jgi:HlyD family secretion protein
LNKVQKKEKEEERQALLRLMEIRSTEVQEIMGFIPRWIIRWGITLFFAVVVVLLAGSWFFKYPDIIRSTIVVTTLDPPATVVARTGGKLQELFVKDKQRVTEQELLAVIETAANYRHVFELKKQLETFKPALLNFDSSYFLKSEFRQDYLLGGLQSNYEIFLKSYSDYRHFIKLDYHQAKIESTQEQIDKHIGYLNQLTRQKDILGEEFKLQEKQFNRIKSLLKEGIVSQNDFESARGAYLQKKHSYEGAKTVLTNEQMQIARLQDSILEYKLQYEQQKTQLQLVLKQAYDNLASQISLWEYQYVLKAPISGVVSFTKYWSVNQNVTSGDNVLTIVPDESAQIIGKLILPIEGSGKVKPGQRVNIQFSNFPHTQYGMVMGRIKSKSLVPMDKAYIVEVELYRGLTTNYGKTLEFSQEMQGVAEIITEDIRLLERIFTPIKSLIEAHREE